MRIKVLLASLLFPWLLPALNNSVTIYEAAGVTQTGRPHSVARWFARGELAGYPKPYVRGGAEITPWQADVKTRWADGSVQFAIVSFNYDLAANGSLAVEFRNSSARSSSPANNGLTPAELLAFNGGSWGAKIETTTSGVTQAASARAMLQALASGAEQLRCWLCGPVVTQMIIEDRTPALAYDFGFQSSVVTLSSVTADAATSTFTAAAHGLANGNRVMVTFNALTSGSVPGGIVEGDTYFVVNASANSFQLSTAAGGAAVTLTSAGSNLRVLQRYADATWTAASSAANKSLHPIFVATAYAGVAAVRIEYILENVWPDRIQDQYFDNLKLYSGSSLTTTAMNSSGFIHSARSRWRKVCWDGAAPAGEPVCGTDPAVITPRPKGVVVDYNFPYMVYSGQVPPFDTTRQNLAFRIADFWTCYSTAPCDTRSDLSKGDIALTTPPGTVSAAGPLMAQQYQTGVDVWGLVGLMPTSQVLHLYVMGDTTQTITTRLRAAEMAIDPYYALAYYGTHFRENNAAKKYLSVSEEPDQTTSAFGRTISVDARPSLTTQFDQVYTLNAADKLVKTGEVRMFTNTGNSQDVVTVAATAPHFKGGDASSFNSDHPHSWMPVMESFLYLGDWYAMEELQYWASWYQTTGANLYMNGGFDTKALAGSYGTHPPWAIFSTPENYRARAWAMRALGYALIATPTEDPYYAPMRTYYKAHYRLNLYTMEGVIEQREGLFHSAFPAFTNWSCSGWNNTAMTLPGLAASDYQTAWCWGRMNQARGVANPLHLVQWNFSQTKTYQDYTKCNEQDAPWHWWYMFHNLYRHAQLGIEEAQVYLPNSQRVWVDSAADQNVAFLMSGDTIPVTDLNSVPFTSWQQIAAAFKPGFNTMNRWCEIDNFTGLVPYCGASAVNDAHGGPVFEYKGMLALSENVNGWATTQTGTRAWDWVLGNVPYQIYYGSAAVSNNKVDPRYGWIPQFIRNLQVAPAVTQASFRWSSFSADSCKLAVGAAGFATSDDAADQPVTLSGRSGSYVAGGLAPGTQYQYRLTCGPSGGTVRRTGSFTTATSGGASVMLRLAPPSWLPVSVAVVDFGSSTALGNTSGPQPCSSGCSVFVSGTAGTIIHYKVNYLNASGQTLTAGSVQHVVP